MKFIKWEKSKKSDDLILEFKEIFAPDWLLRRFGFKYSETTRKFIGHTTVWYEITKDGFSRCGTEMEHYLSEVFAQIEYENKL